MQRSLEGDERRRAAPTPTEVTHTERISVMKATLNRDVERVFNPDRKDHDWEKRKLRGTNN
jgi:hypothetical protein